MKVLSVSEMRAVDRLTIEAGIPGLILMENAGCRVVEFLERRLAPLASHRIVIFCGKGNNGGDGLVIARQLHIRVKPAALDVVLAAPEADLSTDAAENLGMFRACGGRVSTEITPAMEMATVVVDALLGTGLSGPPQGQTADLIRRINEGFPLACRVAVDIPSGLPGDGGSPPGVFVRADYTVTFTAPKTGHVLPPGCDLMGEFIVVPIGSPPELYERDDSVRLSLVEPQWLRPLLSPRPKGAHKGDFGHVLVIGGSRGKTGAAAMAGMAALRAGAGLSTVACAASALPLIASHAPEVMTEELPETAAGAIAAASLRSGRLLSILQDKDVIAIGPGLGTSADAGEVVRYLLREVPRPMVLDADALNVIAEAPWEVGPGLRVFTPHPGEMSRLTGVPVAEIQANRVETARSFAMERQVTLVLKGQRTLVAFPDGRVWVNPTGSPAMATGGSGDILTGMLAGFLAQFPAQSALAVAAAVYLHGLAGESGARQIGEAPLTASDLLRFLPDAFHAFRNV